MNDKLGIKFIFITIVIIGFVGMNIDANLGTNFSAVLAVASAVGFIIYEIRDAQGYYTYEKEEEAEQAEEEEDCEE